MKKKVIVIIAVLSIIAIVGYTGLIVATPRIAKWYINKHVPDNLLLNIIPSEELNNIINHDYLTSLQRHQFNTIEICLPAEFNVTRDKKQSVSLKRMSGDNLTGFILLSYHGPRYFLPSDKYDKKTLNKLEKIGIKDDYDYFTKVVYSTKKEIKRQIDMVFIMIKDMYFAPFLDKKNCKIYKYANKNQRGYILANVTASKTDYGCYIFDQENNYFDMTVRTMEPVLSLEDVCTILSTLKKL